MEGDYMCKIDLKDAYFYVVLSKESRKLVRFQWEGSLYEFLCFCFGLDPAPRAFTNVTAKAFDDSGNNIPGRSINFQEYYGRDTRSTGPCNISATALRICDKFQEVCFRTNSGNRVSGYDCELKDNDIVFTP